MVVVVGVDIDGVLGNQIAGVIPRVLDEYGITLTFDMIEDWRFSFGPSDVATEIAKAQGERNYIEYMPVFPGAREMLAELSADHRVVIMTARPLDTREATEAWLSREQLTFDELVFAPNVGKLGHGVEVLIDDYLGNVLAAVATGACQAILVRRPWNKDDRDLMPHIATGRAEIVKELSEIPDVIRRLYCGGASYGN